MMSFCILIGGRQELSIMFGWKMLFMLQILLADLFFISTVTALFIIIFIVLLITVNILVTTHANLNIYRSLGFKGIR